MVSLGHIKRRPVPINAASYSLLKRNAHDALGLGWYNPIVPVPNALVLNEETSDSL